MGDCISTNDLSPTNKLENFISKELIVINKAIRN